MWIGRRLPALFTVIVSITIPRQVTCEDEHTQLHSEILATLQNDFLNDPSIRNKRQTNENEQHPTNPENEQNSVGSNDVEEEQFEPNDDQLSSLPTDHFQVKRFFSRLRMRPIKADGYKRGPGFRSWGGKRGRFSNWGGKRGEKDEVQDPIDTKRTYEFAMPFEQYQKRTNPMPSGKRRPFQSWGGKRTTLPKILYFNQPDWRKVLSLEGKRKFSSWGGKRSFDDISDLDENEVKRSDDLQKKKLSFRSWGGKRSSEEGLDSEADETILGSSQLQF